MRAVVCLRVSTGEQVESGLGLEAQEAACTAAVIGKGGQVVAVVSDDGVSGATPALERPGILAAVTMIRAGEADAIVVSKLDRLGRSAIDVLGVADLAEREGWALVILDLGLDTTTPVGRFTLTILAAVAELERSLIRQRTREAMAAKRARGERVGRPPELTAEQVDAVRTVAAGRTLRATAALLDQLEVPTARGKGWSASSVRWVLSGRAA